MAISNCSLLWDTEVLHNVYIKKKKIFLLTVYLIVYSHWLMKVYQLKSVVLRESKVQVIIFYKQASLFDNIYLNYNTYEERKMSYSEA